MAEKRPPRAYLPEFWHKVLELARSRRSVAEISRKFDVSQQNIMNNRWPIGAILSFMLTRCAYTLSVIPTKTVVYCQSGHADAEVIDRALNHVGGGSLDPYPFSEVVRRLRMNGGAIVYYRNRVIKVYLATGGIKIGEKVNPAKMGPFYPPADHGDISAAAIENSGKRYLSLWLRLKKMNGWRFEFSRYSGDVCK
jgi:hypothetical protein